LIGGYDLRKYAKYGLTEKDIMWHKVMDNAGEYFWTLYVAKVRLSGGNKTNHTNTLAKSTFLSGSKDEIKLSTNKLVLDTGMSFGTAPDKDMKELTDMMSRGYNMNC